MKQFFNVLSFELSNYFKNKGYMITTILFSIILVIGLSLPSFFDMSKLIPQLAPISSEDPSSSVTPDEVIDENKANYVIVDNNNILPDLNTLETAFTNSSWTKVNTTAEAENIIKAGDAEAGFILESLNKYSYLVDNSGFTDTNQMIFENLLSSLNQQTYAIEHNLDINDLQSVIYPSFESDVTILGKDSANNFFYVYIFIFAMYMMILLYGQLIAVSVTSEKSNRAIEVLVTSASSNSLIFGKVIAAALASFLQVGIILASGMITYSLNSKAWNGILDGVFKVPSNILLTFILFGAIGYLFYSFIFGALGSLVSKTEDISSSIGPITMIFVIVFFISMFGLTNSDSLLIKIASFIPFSSSMTMLIRVAMGTVSNLEIIISFIILLISTILTALGAAKIYRLGTLIYGNPIKLRNALKWFKKEKIS
ncbi:MULTISPECIES: ABC transporter permease [unclassified Clostridium]|uniref:ABC transporter permease n=1 Tax=unclassified Clostridium TaxID=2614128 RepID=UPI001C8B54D9|nr:MULTISPECIES: ABC transporter permease [unclassified Clostridium]MBX9138271.1 ABC transporter permease [Clostridium sp. K12(2020)]MBX9144987.1 ABC transporter permease [Clostridium sp. K13]